MPQHSVAGILAAMDLLIRFSMRGLLLATVWVAVSVAAWTASQRHGGFGFEPWAIRIILLSAPLAGVGAVIDYPRSGLALGLLAAILGAPFHAVQ